MASTSGPIVCNRSGFYFGLESDSVPTQPEMAARSFVDGNDMKPVNHRRIHGFAGLVAIPFRWL